MGLFVMVGALVETGVIGEVSRLAARGWRHHALKQLP
ncbi:hypothetical protein [Nonomuraea dietziae]|uniref:Na+/H+ antiporter NhaD/arsenite permease-like protein n=1 Tax=Nonomuraea dietziae TaxID=65515 RepID=A0A7W5V205_9ACTN|nr:Na+/H+ antiporter NhaD/arsenite permease-like protein [Nonomuraea dietziae]